jgi:hypothetical protein
LHLHPHVDLPDGSYTLVPEGGDEGADGELQYVGVAQDLNQSPEGPQGQPFQRRQAPCDNPPRKIP